MNIRCHACKSTDLKKVTAIISQGSQSIKLGHGGISASRGGGLGGALGKTGGTIQSDLAKKLSSRKPNASLPIFFSMMTLLITIILGNKWGFFHHYTIISSVLFVLSCRWYIKSDKKETVLLEKFKNEWYCYTCGEISLTPGYANTHKEKMAKLKKSSKPKKKNNNKVLKKIDSEKEKTKIDSGFSSGTKDQSWRKNLDIDYVDDNEESKKPSKKKKKR